jgi:membrane-bound serine protease (ClpP class)
MRLLWVLLLAVWSLAWAKTYLIPIEGEIDPALAVFVEQSLQKASQDGATGVVFWVDTPGGRVDAALKISDLILSSELPTLAVVQNAFSAGALISLSAQKIAMLPGSEIGAALPIIALPNAEPQAADRKVISALRAKFRSVAEARNRPPELAEAMVDPDRPVKGLNEKGEPLTLSGDRAVQLKVAEYRAENLPAALKWANFDPDPTRLEAGTRVQVARFLTNATVAALLLSLGILGLVLELFTPGLGWPGILGAMALALYFLGGYLAGLSSALNVVLFVAGLILLVVELLITPGFGLAGIGGLALLGASVYFTFGDESLRIGAYAVVILAAGLVLIFRLAPRTRLARGLVLESAIAESGTDVSHLLALQGQRGKALTDLRPAGSAEIQGHKVDVVTQGGFITQGSPVQVIQVEGNRVVVQELPPDAD